MKIALIGYGKMGKETEQVALSHGHEITVRIDNVKDWTQYSLDFLKSEVAIVFSSPDKAVENIYKCFNAHIPVVVGSTGWYDEFENVVKHCNENQCSLFYAPNFSIGMNMMFYLNKKFVHLAEKYHYNISIYEAHHSQKVDMPSGTAIKLANDIIRESEHYEKWTIDQPQKQGELPIEVVREGNIKGIHEVKAISDIDCISLKHEAFSRKGFAVGAVMAAEFLTGKKGVFTMHDLIHS